ncbi:hypothetical protein N7539_000206 [Penicillium diatomitis]|uniref:DUF7728 domain-containing protein n=1 Tax=Penicillium diatomitis TaxID=2819901 RepID=A0A9W9XM41_9EURO|nr:uncharacterized protein N7539_000206 [Penicillium diatomitis]KAJ5495090.1 hypothetical protein N7539_000206 [Penicillium diatomitis]
MLARSLMLLGGAAVLPASSMLIPPEMEHQMEPVQDGFMNVHPVILADAHHAMVSVPCQDCPFREVDHEGVATWVEGKSPSLPSHPLIGRERPPLNKSVLTHDSGQMLDFSIEDNLLLANGRQIFPPVDPGPLRAIQQLQDGQISEPMALGYALEMMPLETSDKDAGSEIYDVRLTILDLERHPVPVDTVAVTLLQAPDGELFIAKTKIEPTAPPSSDLSWKKCDGKVACLRELAIARVRGLLAAAKGRVAAAAGKTGRKGCHGKHNPAKGMGAFSEFEKEHHWGGHRHHHHHHRPHGAFVRTFRRIIHFIIVPALVGILAGVAASSIGMLIGQAVVFMWRRYRVGQPQEHKASWEQGESCEKQSLIEDSVEVSEQDDLPQYTESVTPRGSMDKN